jgi:ribonuclease-3 family protein
VFRRARNAKKTTRAKHASVAEYNQSTGFEAVIGYLYIIGEYDRLNFLLNKGHENEG